MEQSKINNHPVSALQYATIFVCFVMNILDGMDVLVISYCAPAIAKSWSVSPEALGAVFSSGLAGMTIGALFLAPFADQIGRKKLILIAALIMGASMYATSFSQNVTHLVVFRFISGIGIGSMLASTAALTAEFTPDRTKGFWVSAVIAGYPVGAVLSGLVAAEIVPEVGWQRMFQLAGWASLITLPLIFFLLTESIEFYLKKQPVDALGKVNQILSKMGREQMNVLPAVVAPKKGIPIGDLLKEDYRRPTFQLWLALFLSFCTLYFLTSWIPKLATNAGLPMSLAIYAGTVFNVGAFFGILIQGYLSSKLGLRRVIGSFFLLTAVLLLIFKFFVGTSALLLIFGLLGFGIQGGFVGLYAVAASMYPTAFRTTGVGWAIGIGRLGGIAGPAIGGFLIGAGLTMVANFLIFAIPTVLAGLATFLLSSKEIS